jgi:hypothetical protein
VYMTSQGISSCWVANSGATRKCFSGQLAELTLRCFFERRPFVWTVSDRGVKAIVKE